MSSYKIIISRKKTKRYWKSSRPCCREALFLLFCYFYFILLAEFELIISDEQGDISRSFHIFYVVFVLNLSEPRLIILSNKFRVNVSIKGLWNYNAIFFFSPCRSSYATGQLFFIIRNRGSQNSHDESRQIFRSCDIVW